MQFCNRFWLLGIMATCLAQGAFADCSSTSTDTSTAKAPAQQSSEQEAKGEPIVFLKLVLNKSGSVRSAKFFSGTTTLKAAAIKATKRRKFKPTIYTPTNQMMVTVKFPADKNGAPEIREALPGGDSGCIFGTVSILPEAMQSRLVSRVEPVYPLNVQAQHIEGVLVLRVRIDKEGNVTKVEKVSGPDMFFPAAREAIMRWKYQPFTQPFTVDNQQHEVVTTIELKVP